MFIKALQQRYTTDENGELLEKSREYYVNSIAILTIRFAKDEETGITYGARIYTNKGEYYVPASFEDDFCKLERLIDE